MNYLERRIKYLKYHLLGVDKLFTFNEIADEFLDICTNEDADYEGFTNYEGFTAIFERVPFQYANDFLQIIVRRKYDREIDQEYLEYSFTLSSNTKYTNYVAENLPHIILSRHIAFDYSKATFDTYNNIDDIITNIYFEKDEILTKIQQHIGVPDYFTYRLIKLDL